MISRFRLLTALLALLAFGLAGAERLWASASAEAPASVAACSNGMSGDCAHGSRDSSAPEAPCPPMPAGMTGACSAVVAALPAEALVELFLLAAGRLPPGASLDAPVLLLTRGLFHPPRA